MKRGKRYSDAMALSLNDETGLRACTGPVCETVPLFSVTDPVTDSNCYLLKREDACVVIDPNCFSRLLPVLREWNPASVLVLLTHEHCDHISALNALRKRFHTITVASRDCSLGIQDTRLNMSRLMETFLYYKNGETVITPYTPFRCEPSDLCFDGEIRLPFGNEQFEMKSLPGHTPGCSVIRFGGRLFCGDYLLPGEQVLTRLPGGSQETYEACARPWLRTIPDGTWIYPGHGREFQMCGKVREFHEL